MEVTPLAGGPAHATETAHHAVLTAPVSAAPTVIHMPSPSYWPLLCSIGLVVMASGILFVDWLGPMVLPVFLIVGLLILIGSIYGWSFEPA
jgi:cytochrome c oxidase subunit 1